MCHVEAIGPVKQILTLVQITGDFKQGFTALKDKFLPYLCISGQRESVMKKEQSRNLQDQVKQALGHLWFPRYSFINYANHFT